MKAKRLISLSLSLALAASFVVAPPVSLQNDVPTLTASAETYTDGYFTYADKEDGTLELTKYTGTATSVTIKAAYGGKTITSIASGAFSSNPTLQQVLRDTTFPSSITQIGSSAFSGCTALNYVELPTSLVSLGDSTFSGCIALKDITFNCSDLNSIGRSAFQGCTALTEITFASSPKITSIEESLFSGCSALAKITIPASVKEVKSNAFRGCTALQNIILHDNITAIYAYAFQGCTGLINVDFPSKLLTLNEGIFQGCTALRTVNLAAETPNLINIKKDCFAGCTTLDTVVLPNTLEAIGDSVFSNDGNLRSIVLPSKLTTISSRLFYDCSTLSSVTMGANIAYIGESAFAECDALSQIGIRVTGETGTFPNALTTLGKSAFANMRSLTYLDLSNTKILIVPESLFASSTSGDKTKSGLTDIKLPDSVSKIEKNAFQNCYFLGSTKKAYSVFPAGFSGDLSQVDFAAIDNYVASNDAGKAAIETGTEYFQLPANINIIDDNSFSGCALLKAIEIPGLVVSIKDGAFAGCSSLQYVKIPSSVVGIYETSFAKNSLFKSECDLLIASIKAYYKDLVDADVVTQEEADADIRDYTAQLDVVSKTQYHTSAYSYASRVCGDLGKIVDSYADFASAVTPAYLSGGEYDGKPKTPAVTGLTYGGTALVANTDYSVSYINNSDVSWGTGAAVLVTGKGKYLGAKRIPITITPQQLTIAPTFVNTAYNSAVLYNGSKHEPSITLRDKFGNVLSNVTEYQISFSNNLNAGTASVVATGTGNYTGSITKNFTIAKLNLTGKAAISLSQKTFTYNGVAQKPTIKITVPNSSLKVNTDYTVSYSTSAINAGTVKVTITGKGSCYGSVSTTYTIKPLDISNAQETFGFGDVEYTGKAIKPEINFSFTPAGGAARDLKLNKDFTVTRKNNVKPGKSTYTVTGKGNFTGKKVGTFNIYVGDLKSSPVATRVSRTKFKTKWEKYSGVTGYQVQISTKQTFAGKKLASKFVKTLSYTYTKAKTGTSYYVRVRPYVLKSGKKVYSKNWTLMAYSHQKV